MKTLTAEEILALKPGMLVQSTQKSLAERTIGDEADAEFLAGFEDAVGFRPTGP
jgi:hypothetical protein